MTDDKWSKILKESEDFVGDWGKTLFQFLSKKIDEGYEDEQVADALNYNIARLILTRLAIAMEGKTYKETRPKWYSNYRRKEPFRNLPCADHMFFTKDGYVVLEPYNRSLSEFKKLVDLCEKEDWNFTVYGESSHLPAHTFRIKIIPNKIEEKMIEDIIKVRTPSPSDSTHNTC